MSLCIGSPAAADGPAVTRFVACADVAQRACVGESRRFGLDAGTIWAYAELDSRGAPGPVEMVWRQDGRVVFTAELSVGRSRRWRTWSRKRIAARDSGGWTVTLRPAGAPEQAALAVIGFAVGDGPVPEAALPDPVVPTPGHRRPTLGEAAEDAPPPAPADPAPTPARPATSHPEAPSSPPAAPPAPTALTGMPSAGSAVPEPPGALLAAPPAPAPAPSTPPAAALPAAAPPAAATPAAAPPTAAPPAAAPPAAAPPPAGQPTPEPSADARCRAWVDVRIPGPDGPRYQALDVRIGDRITAHGAPGLVVAGPDGLHALNVVRRAVTEQGPGGVIERSWDMLLGRPVSGGSPRVWAGFPATMAPPERGEPERSAQHHPLTVVSVIGPHVGARVTLTRTRGEEIRVRARALTASAGSAGPGVAPAQAVNAAFAGLPAARRPDPAAVEPTHFALRPTSDGLRVLAIAPCCGAADGAPVEVEADIAPPDDLKALWPLAPGPLDCRVGWRDGRVVAGRGDRLLAVGPAGVEALLGVAWIPVSHPHRVAAQRRAVETLR